MREASFINILMHKIEAMARQQGAKKVRRVQVWLGALSHLSPDHFREFFAIAATGTLAAGADLTIHQSVDFANPDAQSILLESIDADE